jgi:hypothetical protein
VAVTYNVPLVVFWLWYRSTRRTFSTYRI